LVLAAAVAVAGSGVGATSASASALPRSPLYGLRGVNEHVRIALSAGTGREQLRATFAHEHIVQARAEAASGDREAARELLRDGEAYIAEAEANLKDAGRDQQGDVQSEIKNLTQEEQQVGGEVEGKGSGSQGGTGGPSGAQPGGATGGAAGQEDRGSISTAGPDDQPGPSSPPAGGGSQGEAAGSSTP
jgi:hypothetical protein